MQDYLIVDGYNIIFAWPEFELLRKDNMEHVRAKLVDILVNYSAMVEKKVVLVFDAHLVSGNKEKFELVSDKLEVVYTQEGETADSVIEKIVGKLSKDSKVYVVTSDWAEQSLVFGMGAYRITPKELSDSIKKIREKASSHYYTDLPADSYLENRLVENVRREMEKWRRQKG